MFRDTGRPKSGYNSVLPSHYPDHNKTYFDTTHKSDYTPPYPYTPAEVCIIDNSSLWVLCYQHTHTHTDTISVDEKHTTHVKIWIVIWNDICKPNVGFQKFPSHVN